MNVDRPAKPLVVAHRGASVEYPENTIEAFEAAIVGADAVEFDVRMTADGHAVVMHDPDVSRTTDGTGLVSEMTLDEIVGRADAGGGARVPVRPCRRRHRGQEPAEEPGFTPEREAAVEARSSLDAAAFSGQVIVSSFNPSISSRALRPDVPTGLLTQYDVDAEEALAMSHGHPWVLPFVLKVLEAGDGVADQVGGALLGVDRRRSRPRAACFGSRPVATNDPRGIVPVRDETVP